MLCSDQFERFHYYTSILIHTLWYINVIVIIDDIVYELSTLDITTSLSLVLQQFHNSEVCYCRGLIKYVRNYIHDLYTCHIVGNNFSPFCVTMNTVMWYILPFVSLRIGMAFGLVLLSYFSTQLLDHLINNASYVNCSHDDYTTLSDLFELMNIII